MAARPELVRLKYSSDGDAAIRAAIATTGSDPIQTGELVVGVENFQVKLYSKDATGRIVEAVSGYGRPTIDGGDFNTSVPVLSIGQPYGGGYFAGLISFSENSIATHALIVSPKIGGQITTRWKTTSTTDTGSDSNKDGFFNTNNMNDSLHPAAQFARSLSIGGYTDWYLPSRFELDILYYNLKPTTQSNLVTTKPFTNTIALTNPPQGSFTASNPLRTTAVLFQNTNSEAFSTVNYGSSTAFSTSIYVQRFSDGAYGGLDKASTSTYRAIRKIPL